MEVSPPSPSATPSTPIGGVCESCPFAGGSGTTLQNLPLGLRIECIRRFFVFLRRIVSSLMSLCSMFYSPRIWKSRHFSEIILFKLRIPLRNLILQGCDEFHAPLLGIPLIGGVLAEFVPEPAYPERNDNDDEGFHWIFPLHPLGAGGLTISTAGVTVTTLEGPLSFPFTSTAVTSYSYVVPAVRSLLGSR